MRCSCVQPRDQLDSLIANAKLGWNVDAIRGCIPMRSVEVERYGHSLNPTWNERERIFGKHVYQKRHFDACGFGYGEGIVSICIRGDQAVTFHNYPLIGVSGAVLLNPIHFTAPVTGRDHSQGRFLP